MRYFEDFVAGIEADYGGTEITKDAILEFARAFDPQPMHLDEEAAKKTLLKGLGASGLHSNAAIVRMTAEEFLHDAAVIDLFSVREFRWKTPVRPADRLFVHARVERVFTDPAHPGVGFVQIAKSAMRNRDEVAVEMDATYALARRDAPPVAPFSSFDPKEGEGLEKVWTFSFETADMLAFARQFDPLPQHVDEAAAARSVYGGLVASPWHLCAQNVHAIILHRREEVKRVQILRTGPSPGWRDLRWHAPVRPGDTITYYRRIESLRRREAKPEWGVQTVRMIAKNQREEAVFSALVSVMVQMPPET